MYKLLNYIEDYKYNKHEYIQESLLSYITSIYFPWLCLVLFVNGKNFKKVVIGILIIHWFLKSSSSALIGTGKKWLITSSFPSVLRIVAEIIADWYLYLRTEKLVSNKKDSYKVYFICVAYNMIKGSTILCFYLTNSDNQRKIDEKYGNGNNTFSPNTTLYHITILLTCIAFFIYNFFVSYALRKDLSIELFDMQSYSFYGKFKRLSEYRIVIFMMVNLTLLPFIILVQLFITIYSIVNGNKILLINIEPLRQSILNINYVFMYLDQVLLNYYIKSGNELRSDSLKSLKDMELMDSLKNLNVYLPVTTKDILQPLTPSSIDTFAFNDSDLMYKRNGIYLYKDSQSCESLNSQDEIFNTLTMKDRMNKNKNDKNDSDIISNYLHDFIYPTKENDSYLGDGENTIININKRNSESNASTRNNYRNSICTVEINSNANNNDMNENDYRSSIYTVNEENPTIKDDYRSSIYTVDEENPTIKDDYRSSIYTVDEENINMKNDYKNKRNTYTVDIDVNNNPNNTPNSNTNNRVNEDNIDSNNDYYRSSLYTVDESINMKDDYRRSIYTVIDENTNNNSNNRRNDNNRYKNDDNRSNKYTVDEDNANIRDDYRSSLYTVDEDNMNIKDDYRSSIYTVDEENVNVNKRGSKSSIYSNNRYTHVYKE